MSKVPKFHRNQNLVINNGNDIFKKKKWAYSNFTVLYRSTCFQDYVDTKMGEKKGRKLQKKN